MAKYLIKHQYERTWVGKTNNGYEWVSYEQRETFQNYFKAKAALDTMPIERDSYNFECKHYFMKVD